MSVNDRDADNELAQLREIMERVLTTEDHDLVLGRIANNANVNRDALVSYEEHASLHEDNRRLFEDVKRLRDWKDRITQERMHVAEDRRRLEGQVDKLEEKVLRKDEEIEVWRSRYRALLDEKVELAERLAVSDS